MSYQEIMNKIEKLATDHDWAYMMSDDGGMHNKGKRERAELGRVCARAKEECPHALNSFIKTFFETHDGWPYTWMNQFRTKELEVPDNQLSLIE